MLPVGIDDKAHDKAHDKHSDATTSQARERYELWCGCLKGRVFGLTVEVDGEGTLSCVEGRNLGMLDTEHSISALASWKPAADALDAPTMVAFGSTEGLVSVAEYRPGASTDQATSLSDGSWTYKVQTVERDWIRSIALHPQAGPHPNSVQLSALTASGQAAIWSLPTSCTDERSQPSRLDHFTLPAPNQTITAAALFEKDSTELAKMLASLASSDAPEAPSAGEHDTPTAQLEKDSTELADMSASQANSEPPKAPSAGEHDTSASSSKKLVLLVADNTRVVRDLVVCLPQGSGARDRMDENLTAIWESDGSKARFTRSCLSNRGAFRAVTGEREWRWLRVLDQSEPALFSFALAREADAKIGDIENDRELVEAFVKEAAMHQPSSHSAPKELLRVLCKHANKQLDAFMDHRSGAARQSTEQPSATECLSRYACSVDLVQWVCDYWRGHDLDSSLRLSMFAFGRLFGANTVRLLSIPSERGSKLRGLQTKLSRDLIEPRLGGPNVLGVVETLRVLSDAVFHALPNPARSTSEENANAPNLPDGSSSLKGDSSGSTSPDVPSAPWSDAWDDLLGAVGRAAFQHRRVLRPSHPLFFEVARFFAHAALFLGEYAGAVVLIMSEAGLIDPPPRSIGAAAPGQPGSTDPAQVSLLVNPNDLVSRITERIEDAAKGQSDSSELRTFTKTYLRPGPVTSSAPTVTAPSKENSHSFTMFTLAKQWNEIAVWFNDVLRDWRRPPELPEEPKSPSRYHFSHSRKICEEILTALPKPESHDPLSPDRIGRELQGIRAKIESGTLVVFEPQKTLFLELLSALQTKIFATLTITRKLIDLLSGLLRHRALGNTANLETLGHVLTARSFPLTFMPPSGQDAAPIRHRLRTRLVGRQDSLVSRFHNATYEVIQDVHMTSLLLELVMREHDGNMNDAGGHNPKMAVGELRSIWMEQAEWTGLRIVDRTYYSNTKGGTGGGCKLTAASIGLTGNAYAVRGLLFEIFTNFIKHGELGDKLVEVHFNSDLTEAGTFYGSIAGVTKEFAICFQGPRFEDNLEYGRQKRHSESANERLGEDPRHDMKGANQYGCRLIRLLSDYLGWRVGCWMVDRRFTIGLAIPRHDDSQC